MELKTNSDCNTTCDGFVSSSLWFLSEFAEAPWVDGGTRSS